ncbi:O-methyltransferase [Leptospira inadai serovar Lyme str. 10]|uniref:O-methyltransferase n=2 Tax=Leptospira inadai serovar Lyme TaxID=293084 RepID=V6HZT8_9LEPT|nr:class I SAM-dependent methyltransferase [Leptospira inadai]EQA38529.1 O-methyltransferase [Leptospira inadai serovar Lyme str. 10]PNV72242.1 methyltransferase [Leptospira inadai serovar Lyme]
MTDSKKHPDKKGLSLYKDGLEEWIDRDLVRRPYPWLYHLEENASRDKVPVLSPASGGVLSFLVSSWAPARVLELGTGYGVSLIWIYSALSETAKIQSVDREIQFMEMTQSYLDRLVDSSSRVELLRGECVEALRRFLSSTTDEREFLFVDCDKVRYPEILKLLRDSGKGRRLRVVFDNVLWHGRPADPDRQAPSDRAIRSFWAILKESGLPYTLFPVGDGLICIDFY